MFPKAYFAPYYYAPRYFPETGAAVQFVFLAASIRWPGTVGTLRSPSPSGTIKG